MTTHEGILNQEDVRYGRFVGRLCFVVNFPTTTQNIHQIVQITFPLTGLIPEYVRAVVMDVDRVHVTGMNGNIRIRSPLRIRYLYYDSIARVQDQQNDLSVDSQIMNLSFPVRNVTWARFDSPVGLYQPFHTVASVRGLEDGRFE
jgi:hypothetical protein